MSAPFISSTTSSTGTNPDGWRRWWAVQSQLDGTDWRGLISLHFDICTRLQAISSSWASS
jgi:hypothetical protein